MIHNCWNIDINEHNSVFCMHLWNVMNAFQNGTLKISGNSKMVHLHKYTYKISSPNILEALNHLLKKHFHIFQEAKCIGGGFWKNMMLDARFEWLRLVIRQSNDFFWAFLSPSIHCHHWWNYIYHLRLEHCKCK